MIWTPENKAEQLFIDLFETKSNMSKELGITRKTLDSYLKNNDKMFTQIKKIARLKNISELTIFKAITS
jgi:DNA-binding XRE family transcriptional regulator|tara:strand:+ start:275 stop:481 length:207 start_codon:yes stop_codon:yes gene_type:complete